MAYKLYNPDARELTIAVRGVKIVIPSLGYAVVDTPRLTVEQEIQSVYPALEVTWVEDSVLEEFRVKQAKIQREAELKAAEAAKLAAVAVKAEAKRVEAKIAQREIDQKEARKKAEEEKLAIISGEQAALKQVAETTVVSTGYTVEVPTTPVKRSGRPKKGQ